MAGDQLKEAVKNISKGAVIGVANIIPGVSGGTLAVAMGIYDRLVKAIGNFLTKREERREHVVFLTYLVIGALASIFLLTNVMEFLYSNYPYPMMFFFIGLIIGSIPTVVKQHKDMKPTPTKVFFFVIGVAAIVVLSLVTGEGENAQTANDGVVLLFASGFVAAASMIIPGVSGSFVLVAMGVYWKLIEAVQVLDVVVLLPAVAGGIFGIITVSKLIDSAIKKYPSQFYYFVLGLIIASIWKLFPGLPSGTMGLAGIAVMVFGAFLSLSLSK
ncbi:MAG: DUF368 domain-containing protein [Candidatus Methanofastidiosia archaeon]